jgi:hypothetical protein
MLEYVAIVEVDVSGDDGYVVTSDGRKPSKKTSTSDKILLFFSQFF